MKDRMSAAEYREMVDGPKPSKMRNVKTEVDGMIFDSQKEASHYRVLKFEKERGEIIDFFMQVPFLLQEGYWKGTEWIKPVWYKADFMVIREEKWCVPSQEYFNQHYPHIKREIHEVKGRWTEVAKVKRKMFEKRYPEYEMKII